MVLFITAIGRDMIIVLLYVVLFTQWLFYKYKNHCSTNAEINHQPLD